MVGGGILHAVTVYRNPVLAGLSAEELAALDALTRKMALPELKSPQIQGVSKPAIEVDEVVESTAHRMRPQPVTCCTNCGAPGYSTQLANGKCGRMLAGTKRCMGTNSSANQENDWAECGSCAGTGYEGRAQCSKCHGSGWLFVRR